MTVVLLYEDRRNVICAFVHVCRLTNVEPPDRLYLVDLRSSRIGSDVEHVDSGGDQRRQNQTVPFLGGIAKAAAAGVPTGVMQLVTKVWHWQPVDDLQGQVQGQKVSAGQVRSAIRLKIPRRCLRRCRLDAEKQQNKFYRLSAGNKNLKEEEEERTAGRLGGNLIQQEETAGGKPTDATHQQTDWLL